MPTLRKLGELLYDAAAAQKQQTAPPVPKPETPAAKSIIAQFKQLDPEDQKAVLAQLKPS